MVKSSRMSAKRTVAPDSRIALRVAAKLNGVVMTSSPGRSRAPQRGDQGDRAVVDRDRVRDTADLGERRSSSATIGPWARWPDRRTAGPRPLLGADDHRSDGNRHEGFLLLRFRGSTSRRRATARRRGDDPPNGRPSPGAGPDSRRRAGGAHVPVTTAPAATSANSPISMPQTIVALAPIEAPRAPGRRDLPVRVLRPRVQVVGEDRARTDEDLVLERDPGVDRDVVLDLDAVADADAGVDEHVAAQRAVGADAGGRPDVRQVPDPSPGSDLGPGFHLGCRVDGDARHVGHLHTFGGSRGDRGTGRR